jgi:hypothetical protein
MVTLPQLPSQPLCRTFSGQAQKIWQGLSRAQAQGGNRYEWTITADFLDDIRNQHPQQVAIFEFNQRDEQFTGADWEWWLTDDPVWLGLLVQAKRLGRHSHKYGIKHWVASAKMWQIDLLLQQARWKGVEPLYCFYNYASSWPGHLTWSCCTKTHALSLFGCTVAHAVAVKNQFTHGGAGLPKMSTVSYPLSCLVCCTLDTPVVRAPLPTRTLNVIRRLRRMADAPEAGVHGLRSEPPNYVRRLLDRPLEDRGRIIEELRREVGEIGSLIVVRETPS